MSGSFLALSHGTDDGRREEAAGAKAILQRGGITQTLRTGTEVEALFAGWELVDPGVVWVSQWHPESSDDIYFRNPEASGLYGGVARKP